MKICVGILIQTGMIWILEKSWPAFCGVESLERCIWSLPGSYQVRAHMHIFSHINSPNSVDWPLQKEVNTVNQEEILRNLSHFPWPPLEGMQKRQKWSVKVSALYLGKRQSTHRFSKLYRNPSFPKEAKGDANEQLLFLDFYDPKSWNQQLQKSWRTALCISNVNFLCILKRWGSSRVLAGSQ